VREPKEHLQVWHRLYDCSVWDCDCSVHDYQSIERWWHAGFSLDSQRCIFIGFDDHPVIVWDVPGRRLLCILDGPEPSEDEAVDDESFQLSKYLDSDGCYVIPNGPGAGRYRVFGVHEQRGRTVDDPSGDRLEIDLPSRVVRVIRTSDASEVVALKYEWFSGDWAFASFSDNGQLFAVIEPYYVTFFTRDVGSKTLPNNNAP